MVTASYIGNDVMDLTDPRCRDRAPGDPLVPRILTAQELRAIERESGEGLWRLALWAHWAAKEAAYKVRSKVRPGGPFFPRSLTADIQISPVDSSEMVRITGTVRGTDDHPPVSISGASDARYLHVLAWSGPVAGPSGGQLEAGLHELREDSPDMTSLRDRFTASEWGGIRSRPGALVRLLARERVRDIVESRSSRGAPSGEGGEATSVQIITSRVARGGTAPKLRVGDSDLPGWDLSLSHHGRYLAWALLVPE